MKKLTILIITMFTTCILAISCEDTMNPYQPEENVWFKANETTDFILSKIWDKSDNNYLRIAGISDINIEQSSILNYNSSGNTLKKFSNSASILINDLAGLSRNRIWCASFKSDNSGVGRIYYFDGESLVNFTPNIFAPKEKNVFSIDYQLFGVTVFKVGKKEHRIFVGESGYVLHFVQKSEGGLKENPEWHEYFVDGREDLHSIWGIDDDNIWAVGESGVVYEYAGNFTWNKLISPTTEKLTDISGYTIDVDINWYAVGDNGTMIFYDGVDIEIVSDVLPTTSSFRAIYVLNQNQGIAVGDKGLVYEFTPESMEWTENSTITNLDCFGCYISSDAKNYFISAGNSYDESGCVFRFYRPDNPK